MGKLLGAILRVRPKLDAEGYDVPEGNPFAGADGVRPELWAKGLRNPWRFSIDRATGDIWIGDVGEEDWEEIDKIPAGTSGQNFGWYWFEGTHERTGGAPDGVVGPVHEYSHGEIGPAVIGGFVYHGDAIPALQGAYVFADMSGPTFARGADGVARLGLPDQAGGVISSLVETPEGELLLLTQRESIYRLVPA
jgi:glucose/arabinose dehydrogenase